MFLPKGKGRDVTEFYEQTHPYTPCKVITKIDKYAFPVYFQDLLGKCGIDVVAEYSKTATKFLTR